MFEVFLEFCASNALFESSDFLRVPKENGMRIWRCGVMAPNLLGITAIGRRHGRCERLAVGPIIYVALDDAVLLFPITVVIHDRANWSIDRYLQAN